ncbi:MAG TPA: methionyl-tRNA formyltransferase [Marinilabiliaceae bacterium]|nr:methionyl-tRNA formyltransferase [Marinilabiliaceae bacterium]
MDDLRIIFMGTPEFAAYNLKVLHQSGAQIVAVVTAPDRPSGRGQKLQPSAVKLMAEELSIPVLQPEKLRDPEFQNALRSFRPDLQVVVAFRMLPESVWNLPPKGTFNLHASLLPQYRGAAPINWAVMNGETKTGVTTFFLNHEIDTGSIIMQESIPISPNDNAGVVHDRLMKLGAELVVKTVEAITNNKVEAIAQIDTQELKPAPKLFREDGRIDWNQTSQKIHNHVRGLSPYPAAWTELIDGEKSPLSMKVFETEIVSTTEQLAPGAIDCDGKDRMLVGTGEGALLVKELQLAGKKRMSTEVFLKGFRWNDKIFFE